MLVNTINSSLYKHPQNYTAQKQVNFQGRLLHRSNLPFERKHLAFSSFACLLSSAILKFTEVPPEIPGILDLLNHLSNCGFFLIKENNIKLDKHIDFKKAETIDDAKLYAKEKFGIKKYEIDDLEYANWINEGLTNVSNRFEGKVYFPKKIGFKERKNSTAAYNNLFDSLNLSRKNIEEDAESLKLYIENIPYEILKGLNYGKGYEEFCEKLKRAYDDLDSLTIFEKFSLVHSIIKRSEIRDQIEDGDFEKIFSKDGVNHFGCVYLSEFNLLYHEIGHCFSRKSKSMLKHFYDTARFNSKLSKQKIPDYDKSKIEEFMACTFAGYMQGEKYSEEIEQLFNKNAKYKFPDKNRD